MIENGSILEAVSIPGTISGSSIVRDLLSRIADKLSRDCSLRPIDVYSGFSYRVTVELQLHDVYPTTVTAEVAVGRIDPRLPFAHIELGAEVAGEESEVSLERPVDPDGVVVPQGAADGGMVRDALSAGKRQYTPRGVTPGARHRS